MANKTIKNVLLIFLCSISLCAENYYWYKGEKINLVVDSTKINVTTNKNVELQTLLSDFETTKVTKNNASLFSVELASTKSYNNIIDNLKSNKDVICISPYYNIDFYLINNTRGIS